MLKKLNPEKRELEIAKQKEIYSNLESWKSFVFESGAGSGKTYALIESIKYLLERNYQTLRYFNQKIIVITYTNVAAKEIISRLGNSNLVSISTIHDWISSWLFRYRKELLNIHVNKINDEINIISSKLNSEQKYDNLNENERANLNRIINKEGNRDLFYSYYNSRAKPSREAYKNLGLPESISKKLMSNMGVFKGIVNNLYKRKDLKSTLERIEAEEEGFKKLKYNPNISNDRLEKMEISHDSLLDYAREIIKDHELLKRILVSRFPYIFIDEYQDTNSSVVEIMKMLDDYSDTNQFDFLVGYFGDEMQSIYSDGIGDRLDELHPGLKKITKNLNRRSAIEVINVINKFKNKESRQETIYSDAEGGSVRFYFGEHEHIEDFIEYVKGEMEDKDCQSINCLMLTNKDIAHYVGIPNIYKTFDNSRLYKEGIGRSRLNEELLNNEVEKLGKVQQTLYRLIHLLYALTDKKATVNFLLTYKDRKNGITLNELEDLIIRIKGIKGDTLADVFANLEEQSKLEREDLKVVNKRFNDLMNRLLLNKTNSDFKIKDYKEFIKYELGKLYSLEELDDEEADEIVKEAEQTLEELCQISIDEFKRWYRYIRFSGEELVKYHTYHGTKGKEYDNVVIIMQNRFWRNENYFNELFKNFKNPEQLQGKEQKTFKEAKNLLYVATSRAIKNLRILYIDPIDDIKDDIKFIFGEPIKFSEIVETQ